MTQDLSCRCSYIKIRDTVNAKRKYMLEWEVFKTKSLKSRMENKKASLSYLRTVWTKKSSPVEYSTSCGLKKITMLSLYLLTTLWPSQNSHVFELLLDTTFFTRRHKFASFATKRNWFSYCLPCFKTDVSSSTMIDIDKRKDSGVITLSSVPQTLKSCMRQFFHCESDST